MEKVFQAKVLDKHSAEYYRCPKCLFLQVKNPHWLAEAYESPINASDTGLLARNINLSEIAAILLYFYFDKNGKFVDFAGGYGAFTRLMRDIGFDFYWRDPFCQNIFAKGFEYQERGTEKIELLTAFECLEHFENPLNEIEKMLKISKNILFSTLLAPEDAFPPNDWFYYGFKHGQHISFFSRKTLQRIADKNNLHFYTNGKNLHLLTEKELKFFSFKLLYRLKQFGFLKLVKRKMKSKTASDSEYLLNK